MTAQRLLETDKMKKKKKKKKKKEKYKEKKMTGKIGKSNMEERKKSS